MLPAKVVVVAVNKRKLNHTHTLRGNRRLHFYAARFLLERISWIGRDGAKPNDGNGKCGLTFSRCKGLSYNTLKEYFDVLKKQNTQIKWDSLDSINIKVRGHNESIWLRAADSSASAIYQGLELSKNGFCEPRYALMLQPVLYRNGVNYFSYGLKFFPSKPAVEEQWDNRYDWLSHFK